jgi:hypothetical protein
LKMNVDGKLCVLEWFTDGGRQRGAAHGAPRFSKYQLCEATATVVRNPIIPSKLGAANSGVS